MRNVRGKVIAVMVVEIKSDVAFAPLLQIGQGLGARGEALLVDPEGRILVALKHPLPGGSRPKPLQYRLQTKPVALALADQRGVEESHDYRGAPCWPRIA